MNPPFGGVVTLVLKIWTMMPESVMVPAPPSQSEMPVVPVNSVPTRVSVATERMGRVEVTPA